MSASDHIQPYQMRLFMTARELMNIPSDDSYYNEPLSEAESLHEEKLEQSHLPWNEYSDVHGLSFTPQKGETSLYDSIKKRGVQKPISIRLQDEGTHYEPHLTNGNHRTAVAHDIDPDMLIPVAYTDYHYDDAD